MEISTHEISISDLGGHDGIKESVYLDFPSTWRGDDVIVTLCASRYTHSSGLSDWQIYGHKVRAAETGSWSSNTYSDTARKRLTDKFSDEVAAWLKTDAYTASEKRAYFYDLLGKVRELRPYGEPPSRNVRRLIDLYSGKLSKDMAGALKSACNRYDAFVVTLNYRPEGI